MTPFGHLRHPTPKRGGRRWPKVAGPSADGLSVHKNAGDTMLRELALLLRSGSRQYYPLAGVIQKGGYPKTGESLKSIASHLRFAAWPSLREFDVTNVTSTGTRNLWLLVAFFMPLWMCEIANSSSYPPLGAKRRSLHFLVLGGFPKGATSAPHMRLDPSPHLPAKPHSKAQLTRKR